MDYNADPHHPKPEHEHESPAEYEFAYSVHDEHTGDIKSQMETRKGNTVQGRYELIDSDGFKRIVEYTADEHNGFNAVVRREPTDIKIPMPAPTEHAKVYHAAPEPKYYQSKPEAKYYQSKPEAKYYQSKPEVKYYQSKPEASYYQPKQEVKYYEPKQEVKYYEPKQEVKYYQPKPEVNYYQQTPVTKYAVPKIPKFYTTPAPLTKYYAPAPTTKLVLSKVEQPQKTYSLPTPHYSTAAPAHYAHAPVPTQKLAEYPNQPNHVSFQTPQVNYHYWTDAWPDLANCFLDSFFFVVSPCVACEACIIFIKIKIYVLIMR